MKKPFFALPRHLPVHTVMTLCIGVGCAYPLSLAIGLTASLPLCAACAAAVALYFAAMDCVPRIRPLAWPLLLLALVLAGMRFASHGPAIGAGITLFLHGQPLALAAYSRLLCAALTILLTAVGASLARSDQAFFPLALLTLAMLFVLSPAGGSISPAALLPLLAALLLAARVHGVGSARILPCAAVVLAVSALFMPLAGSTLPELESVASDVRRMIDDYFFFTEPRTPFSLASTGWQPLGTQRLGGPVNPEDTPVMQVQTPGRALLRGVIKNSYDGACWQDTISGRRYLYVSPRFIFLRRNLFDTARPARSIAATLPAPQTVTVVMRSDATSTLYLTQRFSAPKGDGIVPYFSPSSEVFATHDLMIGDTYTFSGTLMTADTPGVREAVLDAYDASDANYDSVAEHYLDLPDSVEPQVIALAQQISAQGSNAFDSAMELCNYLRTGFPYTLNQRVPPAGRDFVSWFLFEEQQGYCTSFASALAVMARAVGIASRYIEGYSARPEADGFARVTQQNAHAWVELYFPGFGWLSFDPTPGSDGSQDDGDEGDDGDEDANTPEPSTPPDDQPTPTPAPDELTPSPTPTATPTATPTPSPTPSPTPEHNDPSVTPTPQITPQPTPTPTPRPTPPPNPKNDDDPPFPWWLLILLLLIALAVLRYLMTKPERIAARQDDDSDALLVWYRAIEMALLALGIAPQPAEPPASFLMRAQAELKGSVKLTKLGAWLSESRYSSRSAKPAHCDAASKMYGELLRLMKPRQRMRHVIRRMIRSVKAE